MSNMLPEAAAAICIADRHLAGESVERRKALALDIQQAIMRHAGTIVNDVISRACAKARAKDTAAAQPLHIHERQKP